MDDVDGWRHSWIAALDIVPDDFQIRAFDAVDADHDVIVAAPTGSGKTLVADYAVARALDHGQRAFYTTPIKALSNQKFRDLGEIHGSDSVGLLTGDNSILPQAPVVVMTTEVLRNMIYTDPTRLVDVGVVILDEVHYLQDPYRGPVWEEVIIHLDREIRLVCLSATVSNSDQLGAWFETIRGSTDVVVELHRPVELEHLVAVADREAGREILVPVLRGSRMSPEAERRFAGSGQRHRGRYRPPGRVATVALLDDLDMLPAIYFIFSRQQCDEAAAACVRAGIDLTDADERRRIAEIATDRIAHLPPEDLAVLGYRPFLDRLLHGVAAHHAGLVPAFKEIVEACFVEGLIKVVFATETLALGINMPARTVVVDRLSRFRGEKHESVTASEFTQLTGRAGRRGIDDHGYALVNWSPFLRIDELADLARSRDFRLVSAFRPNYNMATHLVDRFTEPEARRVLALSFGQFQTDAATVSIERRLDRKRAELTPLEAHSTSPYGDLDEFRRTQTGDIDGALQSLKPGMVIDIDHGTYRGRAVVVATAQRRRGTRLTVVTPSGSARRLGAPDFDRAPVVRARIDLGGGGSADDRRFRDEVAERLRRVRLAPLPGSHPVEDDPDLADRLAAARQADRVRAEIRRLEARLDAGSGLVARFSAIIAILEARGYIDRRQWHLTERGRILAGIFHESDLLVTEAIVAGCFDGLDAAETAALVSVFVYEPRHADDTVAPWFPSTGFRQRFDRILGISRDLRAEEESAGLDPHRPPDAGFVASAYGWCLGEDIAASLDDDLHAAGDFIRIMKQVVDLLRQIATSAPSIRPMAREAATRVWRDLIVDTAVPTAADRAGDRPRLIEGEP